MARPITLRTLSLAALFLATPGLGLLPKNDLKNENQSAVRDYMESTTNNIQVNRATVPSLYAHKRPWFTQLEHLLSEARADAITLPPTRTSPSYMHSHSHSQHSLDENESDSSYEDDYEEDYYNEGDEIDDEDNTRDYHFPPWLQEEPQNQQPREMSPISQSKWETMGTRSGVDELRRTRMESGAANTPSSMPGYAEAVNNLLRVNRDGDCKVPKPRLVQVKHEYPHPSKIYLPRCTILHQCGDDTGCCIAESLTCVPRHAHRVDLFFYTSTVGNLGPTSLQRIERLSFYNHTECGCEDRNSEILPRDHSQSMRNMNRGLFQGPQPRAERAPQSAISCRCPSKFAVRPVHDGACACDCFDKHRECLRLKKGKEYFNTQDRQCIQKGECTLPTCEFGSYLRLAGRCTKKRERFEAWNQ